MCAAVILLCSIPWWGTVGQTIQHRHCKTVIIVIPKNNVDKSQFGLEYTVLLIIYPLQEISEELPSQS
jgi:hypothetical protein